MERITRESMINGEASVRDLMRTRARTQSRAERGPYRTPQWLDHSFVLPASATLTEVEVSLPSPRVEAPALSETAAVFERPPSREVDFAAVVRRADSDRRARIVTAAGLLLALVAVVVFQTSGQPAAAACAILAALVTFAAAVVRMVLGRAAVPYLET